MYQYPNQEPYHHNSYTNLEVAKLQNVNTTISQEQYQVVPQNTLQNLHQNTTEDSPSQLEEIINEKISAIKSKLGVKKVESSVKMPKKSTVDTSNFSIEERLVAAVWVHERKHTRDSINEIKLNFKRRFDRDPPSKTTLFAWERKLFSTGNVSDAPRTGRPVHRKQLIPCVAASLNVAPALSLRARALALRLPRSTLHHILRHDLPAPQSEEPTTKPKHQTDNKRPVSMHMRQASQGWGHSPMASATTGRARRPPAPVPVPLEATPVPLPRSLPAPPHSHMHYVMHAMHTHKHPLSLGYC